MITSNEDMTAQSQRFTHNGSLTEREVVDSVTHVGQQRVEVVVLGPGLDVEVAWHPKK